MLSNLELGDHLAGEFALRRRGALWSFPSGEGYVDTLEAKVQASHICFSYVAKSGTKR